MSGATGWFVTPEPAGKLCHVHPVEDFREHDVIGLGCWCRPALHDDGWTVVHNSLDQREQYEEGRKPS